MRTFWGAVLGMSLMISGGAAVQAQTPNAGTTHMCRADRKAQKKTQKAEAKAARNNARAAREQVKAEEHRGGGSQKMQSLAVVLTPPPM